MKVTIWLVETVNESGGYCFWTKKEALEFVKKEVGGLRTHYLQDNDKHPWSIEKQVISGSTRIVCKELVNWGIFCAGGHGECWEMA